jgi:hypothetical protein
MALGLDSSALSMFLLPEPLEAQRKMVIYLLILFSSTVIHLTNLYFFLTIICGA